MFVQESIGAIDVELLRPVVHAQLPEHPNRVSRPDCIMRLLVEGVSKINESFWSQERHQHLCDHANRLVISSLRLRELEPKKFCQGRRMNLNTCALPYSQQESLCLVLIAFVEEACILPILGVFDERVRAHSVGHHWQSLA